MCDFFPFNFLEFLRIMLLLQKRIGLLFIKMKKKMVNFLRSSFLCSKSNIDKLVFFFQISSVFETFVYMYMIHFPIDAYRCLLGILIYITLDD